MPRIIFLFHKHGKLAFSSKSNGEKLTCAGKLIVKERNDGIRYIGYILDGDEIIMKTGDIVKMRDIELPK